MSRSSLAVALVASLALTACAKHELPVSVKQCDAVDNPGGATVTVKIHNGSDKAVVSVGITLAFYADFKFNRVNGIGIFRPAIAPNSDADTSLAIANRKDASGQAQRCAITHVAYTDGSQESAEAPTAR